MPLAGGILGEWSPPRQRPLGRGWVRVTGADPDRVLAFCLKLAGARPPSSILYVTEAADGDPWFGLPGDSRLSVWGSAVFDALEALLRERLARTFIIYPFDAVSHPSRPGVAHRANWIGQHTVKLRSLIYRADAQVIVAGCGNNGGCVLDSMIVSRYHVASNGLVLVSNRS